MLAGQRLEAENRLLRAGDGGPKLIAQSPAMEPVLQLISRVGPSDANVLITGEPGVGKEVVSRTLHAISSRSTKPLVTVNAGGLAEGVFESELFGHEKGAFTGATESRDGLLALAHEGTLFLDEVGELPLEVQVMLLRFIETQIYRRVGDKHERQADVRFLFATNRNLAEEARSGRFHDALYQFEVRSPLKDEGLLHIPHKWVLG